MRGRLALRSIPLTGELLVDRARWGRGASPLAAEGTKVMTEFLSRSECDRLIAAFTPHVTGSSRMLGDDSWLVNRQGDVKGYDKKVLQVMNAQHLDAGLEELASSGRIEQLFEEELGEPVVLKSLTVQVDDPDTETKRPWHVDTFRPTLKLFVYLTDVDGPQHGPYTVTPRSHRHVVRKAANHLLNAVTGRPMTDLGHWYTDRGARCFTGQAGTAVLSVQSLAHKGWQAHTERRRYMLVAYLALARLDSAQPFTLGRPTA